MNKLILILLTLIVTTPSFADPNPIKETIKIGAVYSLTGWAAIGGESELNATKMAVDEINLSGGINGKKIELIIEDNQSDLKKTVNGIQKLRSLDKAQIILGPNWAEFSDVAAPICERNKTIMLTASGYSPSLTTGKEYIFTTLPAHSTATQPLSDYIAKQNHKKIAMATSVSAYYESSANSVVKQLKGYSIELSSNSTWNPGTTDFKSYITKLKGEGFDAVVLMLTEGGDLTSFLKQARDLHYSGAIYSSNALLYDHQIRENFELAEGVIFYEYLTRATKEFRDKYTTKHGEFSSFSIPRAYDNVYLLKHAIENCPSSQVEVLKECLRKADYKGVSGRIRFNSSGNVLTDEKQSELYIIRKGKISGIK